MNLEVEKMVSQNVERLEISWALAVPAPIQFVEALYRLTTFFKERGLTNEQIEKGFEYCLWTLVEK